MFKPGDRVRVTESAKQGPFWKHDQFKNGIGIVVEESYGQHGLETVVKMSHPRGGVVRTYYLTPSTLEIIPK